MSLGYSAPSNNVILGTPGVFAWWSADSLLITGGTIDTIYDLVGTSNLVKVSAGPTYTQFDASFNNKPSISSSTANVRMQCTLVTSLAQPCTIYTVINVVPNPATMFWRTNTR